MTDTPFPTRAAGHDAADDGRFDAGRALGRPVRRIRAEPGRALWLFLWDGGTVLMLFLLAAYALGDPEAYGPASFVFALLVAARSFVTEAAWLRFLTGREDGSAGVPLRFGADELRLFGASIGLAFVFCLFLLMIALPVFVVFGGLHMADPPPPSAVTVTAAWALVILAAVAAAFLFPRYMTVMALTIEQRRFMPFTHLTASGPIQGRLALSALALAAIVLVLVLLALGPLFAAPEIETFQAAGAALDRAASYSVRAPLGVADVAAAIGAAFILSVAWLLARGLGAEAALSAEVRARLAETATAVSVDSDRPDRL